VLSSVAAARTRCSSVMRPPLTLGAAAAGRLPRGVSIATGEVYVLQQTATQMLPIELLEMAATTRISNTFLLTIATTRISMKAVGRLALRLQLTA